MNATQTDGAARQALRAFTDTILADLADTTEMVVGVVDLEGRVLAGNAGMEEAAGRPLAQLLGQPLWGHVVRAEDEPGVRALIAALIDGTPAIIGENPWIRPDGTLRSMRWINLPLHDESGAVRWVLGLGRDASVHEALRARVAEAEQRFHLLEEAIDEVFYISNLAAGRLLYASAGFERIWETPVSDLMADVHRFLDRVHPDDRPVIHRALTRQLAGERTEVEYRLQFADGRIRWIRDRAYPVRDAAGHVLYVAGVASDITAQHEAVERLADREQLLSTVFHRSSRALWLLSLDGHVLERNASAVAMSGVAAAESFADLPWASPHDRRTAEALVGAARRGEPGRADLSLNLGDIGAVLDLAMQPVAAPGGGPRYLLAEGLDITQRLQVEARIRELNESLEDRVRERTEALAAASRAKDEFLAVMSHELRTPLMAILGVAESVGDGIYGGVTAAQTEALDLLQTSGRHLLDLIGDLLDLAKLDAGRLPVRFVPTDAADLAREVEQLMHPLAAARNQQLTVEIPATAGTFVVDPVRIRQVLLNLLTNAVKFSPVGARLAFRLENGPSQLVFSIDDEGPGIAESDLSRLFRPFEQLDMHLARQYGGVGLGLALVHRLTALHRGQVAVRPRPSGGTRFEITLPRVLDWPPPTVRRAGTVMLVGEGDAGRARLTEWLEASGFTVQVALDVTEALARVRFAPVDAMLIDADASPLDLLDVPALQEHPVVIVMTVVTAAWRQALVSAFRPDVVLETPLAPARVLHAIDVAMRKA